MQAVFGTSAILEQFNLGGGEIILILAVVLILFGSRHLPALARGLGQGVREFRSMQVMSEIRKGSHDAGRSLGGIYGKPGAQAITPDNHVAELYGPAAFGPTRRPSEKLLKRVLAMLVRTRLCIAEANRHMRDKK